MSVFNPEDKITWNELAPSLQQKIITLIKDTVSDDLKDRNSKIYKALIETLVASIYTNPNMDLRNAIRNAIKQDLLDRTTVVYTALIDTLVASIYTNPNTNLRNAIRNAIKQDLLDRNTAVYKGLIETLVASIYDNPNADLRNAIRKAIKQDLLDRNTIVYTALIETLVASIHTNPNTDLRNAIRNAIKQDLLDRNTVVYTALIDTLVASLNLSTPNNALITAVRNLLIADLGNKSSDVYNALINTLVSTINDTGSNAFKTTLLNYISKCIKDSINDSNSELYKNLRDFISKAIKDAVADTSSELYKNLRELISKTVKEAINDSNSDLHKNLKDFITKAIDEAINDTSSALYEKLKKLISATIKQATSDPSSELYKNLRDFISKAIKDAITNTSSELYENLRELISKTVKESINDVNSELHKNLKDFITKAVDEAINDTTSALYEKLKKLISTTIKQATSDPSSELYKNLKDFISKTIEDAMNDTESNLYENLRKFIAKTIKEAIDGTDTKSELFDVIRTLTFNNLPPKVGFLDDTTVKLQGTYNMSYTSGKAGPYFISDAEGRECLFAVASGTSFSGANIDCVYRATRMTTTEDFSWENNAVRPKFIQNMSGYVKSDNGPMFDSIKATSIWGLTSEWIGLTVGWFNGPNNINQTSSKNYLVFTNGSGSPQNWGRPTDQGYLDVTNVPNLSNMARIEVPNVGVYYIIPVVRNEDITYTDPVIGDTFQYSTQVLYFDIYKATEDRFNDHSVSLTSVRSDKICRGGYSFENSELAGISVFISSGKITYIKHTKHLMYVVNLGTTHILYNSNGGRQDIGSTGDRRYVHGIIDISNFSTSLASATSGYFANKNNWKSWKLGYEYNFLKYGYNDWCLPFPYMTYDELKRTISTVVHETRDFHGYPSRSRLTIFSIDTTDRFNQFIDYMKDSSLSSLFPWSFSIDNNLYPDFKDGVECMNYSILTDDTAPWSKSISQMVILHDAFILNCTSKKNSGTWCYLQPTLLKNPATNAPYKDNNGNDINNVFTCAVGKWATQKGGLSFDNDSIVYTGGDYSEYYSYNAATKEVKRAIPVTITLEDETDAISYQPNVDMELVTTFPDHDPKAILEAHYASEISSHGISIGNNVPGFNGFEIFNSVYGNCSVLGGEFILYYCCFRCDIINGKVSQISGANDDDLKLVYPSLLLYFKNGSYKIYNAYDLAVNTGNSNIYNTFKLRMLDQPKEFKLRVTGHCNGNYHLPFIDKSGVVCLTYLPHTGTGHIYSGPTNCHYDLPNQKMYLVPNGETWVSHITGYSKALGYYMYYHTHELTAGVIFCNRDYLNSNNYKNGMASSILDALNNGKYYTKQIFTSASTGRVAFLSKTPLYLGGYFSYIEPKEIYLEEGHNYIYITRQAVSYELTVDVYDHLIGVPGESQFNRILISHIYVSNGLIATQADYDIAYYSITSMV